MKKKIKEHVCVSCGLGNCYVVKNGDSVFSSLRPPFSLSPKQKREFDPSSRPNGSKRNETKCNFGGQQTESATPAVA